MVGRVGTWGQWDSGVDCETVVGTVVAGTAVWEQCEYGGDSGKVVVKMVVGTVVRAVARTVVGQWDR
eukprot:1233490-Pyramimonas_sp.AAC.1